MGLPFAAHDVTLYHKREGGAVERCYLTNCSWHVVRERTLRDVSMQTKTTMGCICRYSPDQPKCGAGDVLVLGRVADTAEKTAELAGILDKYRPVGRAFMVEAFTDNSTATALLRHYCAKGA